MTLPSSITRAGLGPGYPVFEIQHSTATARVALHGAQLMEWTPTGQKPVIYLSPEAVYHAGKAIRGGIPICWPWFGHHEKDPKLPQHGFVRSRFWELAEATEEAAGVHLKLVTRDDADTRKLWPHSFRLTLELRVGAALQVSLRTENTGSEPFAVTGALHSYFALGDVRQASVMGLDGTDYLDTVGSKTARHQSGDIRIDQEVDRVYQSSAEVHVQDEAWQRTISIQGAGSDTSVVWNPWIEKAKALADLPDEDYLRFVCVETANAWKDQITVAPGA
jgi:D-hexose-6-phosphate mutarotase